MYKEISTTSADRDFVIWFDNNTGEALTFEEREAFEKKAQELAQELAQEFGFDFYYSSNLRGMHKKLNELEQDGFFESEEV